jgi:predicted nucleotidyltransferase
MHVVYGLRLKKCKSATPPAWEGEPMRSVVEITPEEMAGYRATARRRQEQEQQDLCRRQERAWELARGAAKLLKAQFGASRVVVFGSLVRAGHFTPWSDVDIAAWGLLPQDIFRAIGAVMDLDAEIEINLVDVGTCRPTLLAAIEQEGIEL